jgi:hypothetical protein
MDDGLGYNTHTSNPGFPDGYSAYAEAPGATAAGSGMQVTHGVITIIAVASLALVAIGIMFRTPVGASR